jgi:hypothetical protein
MPRPFFLRVIFDTSLAPLYGCRKDAFFRRRKLCLQLLFFGPKKVLAPPLLPSDERGRGEYVADPTTPFPRVKQTSPATCPVCGAKTIRLGRDAWCCESQSCGEKNDSYRRLEQKLKEWKPPAELVKAIEDGIAEVNQTLMAAGAENKIQDSNWSELEAIARIDLGLSLEEFGDLTLGEFKELLKRKNRLNSLHQIPPSSRSNVQPEPQSIPDWSSPLKRHIRTGLNTIQNKGDNEELRRWMIQNTQDGEMKSKIMSKARRTKRVVDVAISEVRQAMKIPAAT